jgi:hypothetical protein
LRLPKSAIVDSRGFAAPVKPILTNSLENLFAFQSTPRAESISVKGFARPGAGFRTRNSGSSANGDRQCWIKGFFERTISGAGPAKKGEIPNARRIDVVLHRNLFRRGVSLRQGLPKVEVAHAHELDLGNRTYPLHSPDGLSNRRTAIPGEILKCPQTAGCNSPSTL